MILTVKDLSIISQETRKAKFQSFRKGINVVTSSGEVDGNWVGKSCLLRSIYHTLGSDGLFSDKWEKEGKYLYILSFDVDEIDYVMLRKSNLFKLYDSKMNTIFSVSDRGELSKELVKLFNQEIFLKSRDGAYKLASPAYNYLLNYIEQKNIKVTKFENFKNLNEFSGYYEDLIYSHLGVRNDKSNSLREKQEKLNITKKELEDREKTLDEMSKEVEKSGGSALDLEVLKDKLSIHEEKYRKLSKEVSKHKRNLTLAYNTKVDLENLLLEFDTLINKNLRDVHKDLKLCKCPTCNNQIHPQDYYFTRIKRVNGFEVQKIDVEDQLNQIKRLIDNENEHYSSILKQINEIEKVIFSSSAEIKDGLKSLGLKEISTSITNQVNEIRNYLNTIAKELIEISKELASIESMKNLVDSRYNQNFNELLLKYPIGDIEPDSIKKATCKINVDGTHVNITTVAWLCTLLKVKYEFNPEAVKYPIIFDTPNNANLDENNEKRIFDLIFDNLHEDGQIITSLVGFNRSLYKEYDINVIHLVNSKYEMLSFEDYDYCREYLKGITDINL